MSLSYAEYEATRDRESQILRECFPDGTYYRGGRQQVNAMLGKGVDGLRVERDKDGKTNVAISSMIHFTFNLGSLDAAQCRLIAAALLTEAARQERSQ